MTQQPELVLIQDSREQTGWGPLFQTPFVVSGLDCGDYSIAGLESLIAVERKSLPDLLNSLTNDRGRFEAELKRARSMHRFFILVECTAKDVLVESFGQMSRANPRSIWGTICIWSTRYHPFILAGNRIEAAKLAEGLLVGYAKEFYKRTADIDKASRRYVQERNVS